MSWIEKTFPYSAGRHLVTSKATDDYNCIAWAAGDDTQFWQHLPGYRWPAKRTPMIESLVEVFESLGYEVCPSGSLENGYEKVVLYERNGMWKHAAKQLPTGKWTSKLGFEEDVEHDAPDCLAGTMYGSVHCYMRRPKNGGEATQPTQ